MRTILAAVIAAAILPASAGAHMTLETDEAAAGSFWKAVLRVPHGCDGEATETLEVTVPEGLIAVKPMPQAGWTLSVEHAPYERSYDYYGEILTEGVRKIRWSGGNLPDAFYDEFVFRGKIDDGIAPGTSLPIKAVQYCATGEARWDEEAAAGQDPHDLEHPAPLLRVAATAGQEAHSGHSAAHAGMATLGDLTVAGAVARATIGSAPTSAVYMTITTAGASDKLVMVESPAAQAAELHTSLEEGGVSKMQPVESIPVSPDTPAELAPGGYHIMMIGLAKPLEDGTTVPVTLTFERAGAVTLDVPVSKDVTGHRH